MAGPPLKETVGLVLVHGIGEQRRFEHLDNELRGFLQHLRAAYPNRVTVEIPTADAAANQATQDTWRGGTSHSLRIIIDGEDKQTHFMVHEVWWADVNEPYSIMKQLRFWLWGLSVWWLPAKLASNRPLAASRMEPVTPTPKDVADARFKIYWVSSFFLAFSACIGLSFGLAKRVLNIDTPEILRTLTNYLSSIKLYNQPTRRGLGVSAPPSDFLDALGMPPRVSIRRRMVRCLADVAAAEYDRWHVLAHSLGSIVAFNGLMEPGYAFANYLDEERWTRLTAAGMAGAGDPTRYPPPAPGALVTPPRPAWLAPSDVVFRDKLFARFSGFLTYGCPLGKFSAIWPALVPFCREPSFPPASRWINVFDPMDPVSGPLRSMDFTEQLSPTGQLCCPPRTTVGYASSNVLLQAHVEFLSHRRKDVGFLTPLTDWLVGNDAEAFGRALAANDPGPQRNPAYHRFFRDGARQMAARGRGMVASWAFVNLVVLGLNLLVFQLLIPWKSLPWPQPSWLFAIGLLLLGPFAITGLVGLLAHFFSASFKAGADMKTAMPSSRAGPARAVHLQPLW